jgi:outer membrane usher protein FimD/PapC
LRPHRREAILQDVVDDGATVNLMSYSVFKKLGREDDELMKTNLTLNGVGAIRWRLEASSQWSLL